MQFQVPQFIEIEDKIVGPLTLKQFLYIAGCLGFAYVSYRLIPITLIGVLLAVAFIAFGLALAFYQYNNRPLIKLVAAIFYFYIRPRLYVWRPRKKLENKTKEVDMSRYRTTKVTMRIATPAQPSSNLSNMSWQVDMTSQES